MKQRRHKWFDISTIRVGVEGGLPRLPKYAKQGADQRLQSCAWCLWTRVQVVPVRGGDGVCWAYTDLHGRIKEWHDFISGGNPKCGQAKPMMLRLYGADCMKRQVEMFTKAGRRVQPDDSRRDDE